MDESSQVFYHIVLIMYLALFLIVWIRNKNDENNYMLNSVLLYTSMMSLGSIGNINMLFRYAHFTMMFLPIFYCSAKYCDDTGEISYIECERGVVTAQDAAIILVCIMVDIYYSFGQWAYLF